jgi:flagellar protein FliL
VATESPAEAPVKPKKKKLIIIIAAVVLLVVAGGGAGLFFMNKAKHAAEDGEEAAHAETTPKVPPTFLPIENMVVNLADPGGERFAQIGVTLELADKKTEDQVKAYMPSIRNSILLLVSQRTSEELLQREGKEKLASDILVEVSRPLGFAPKVAEKSKAKGDKGDKGEKDDEVPKKSAKGKNPVQQVLFSSFIVQ